MCETLATECCLICVNELLSVLDSKALINDDFWFNVKKEIEAL